VLGVHDRSVPRWVAWYRQGGLAAVRGQRMGGVGQPSLLTAEAPAEVAEVMATGRFPTAAAIRDWITEKYRVGDAVGGVSSRLARLRCNPKVPHPLNPKADLEQQEAWKRGLRDALAAVGVTPISPFGFADEIRVGLRGMVRRV
jgi:transposase